MLEKSEDMKIFLRLVDANSTVKQYKNQMGFDGGDVRIHVKFIPYYREYVKMAEEISELAKGKKETSMLKKAQINMEIRRLRTSYRDRLTRLRAGR